jgi:adenylosuccinate lyase
MSLTELTAISPVDGRYYAKTQTASDLFSEFGLQHLRLTVEVRWLQTLSRVDAIEEVPAFSDATHQFLDGLIDNFSPEDGAEIKAFEATTNHDVKAVEYFIKEKCGTDPVLADVLEFVHFACTSEDINNLAYGMMLAKAREEFLSPIVGQLLECLFDLTKRYVDCPMLARTHGQSASPTTLGKEVANVWSRVKRAQEIFKRVAVLGKFNGAVGNFNAHHVAYPTIDWPKLSADFITSLGLAPNHFTTQIEPHDFIAEYCHALHRLNTVLIDLARDMWGYIALDYFKLASVETEVGSSTMPHKVNPIDFENAEGNLTVANSLLECFARELPVSRWQRDLSDSTVLRNLGVALTHSHLAYQSLLKGLGKLEANFEKIQADLMANWQVLAEPIQTVMRRYKIQGAYEKMKALTRGKPIDKEMLHAFIDDSSLPDDEKTRLKGLTPATYVGLAVPLTKALLKAT